MAGCSPEITTGLVLAFPRWHSAAGECGAGRSPERSPPPRSSPAAMLVGGLDHTLADPVRYGARWDAVIDAPSASSQERAFAAVLRADERLTDVAGQLYTEAAIGDEVTLDPRPRPQSSATPSHPSSSTVANRSVPVRSPSVA